MSRPLRVVFLFASRGIGGAERSMLRLMVRTHPHRFESRVLVLAQRNAPFEAAAAAVPIPYEGMGAWNLVGLFRRLRRNRPDVVYLFGRFRTIPWAIVARLAGVRTLVAAERSDANRRSDAWARRLDRFLVTSYAANSRFAAANLRRIVGPRGPRVSVVPNGIEPLRLARTRDRRSALNVLCIGKLTPNKGQIVLLRAVARLRSRWPELRAVLVGQDFTQGRFFGEAEAAGLRDTFVHADFVDDVRPFLSAASVVVLPTLQREGCPTSLLEAMSAGVPVVASAVGGVSEIIDQGRTGLLVPPGDDVALAGAIERILEDNTLHHRIASAARREVRGAHGIDAMVDAHASVFAPLVVHVTTAASSLCYLLLNQLLAIRDAGYSVLGVSAAGNSADALTDRGIPHASVSITRRLTPIADLRSLWQLYKTLRRERPTIVHTHTPKPGLLAQFAARLAGVPVVVNTIHGFYFHDDMPAPKRFFYAGMEKIAAHFSDAILFQNVEDRDTAVREGIAPSARLVVLGNGIDLDRFDPTAISPDARRQARASFGIPHDAPVVGFVGRLVREKGIPELLDAASMVRARFPSVRFLLVGPTDVEKADRLTADSAREHGLADVCVFAGHRDDMPNAYAAMDVFTLPSHREGFPRAAMEACAMGLPCVLTDIRGCRQVVTDGVNGMLVPVRDPAALAQAIISMLQDPALALSYGRAARERALEEFDERRVFDVVTREYERALRDKGLGTTVPRGALTEKGGGVRYAEGR